MAKSPAHRFGQIIGDLLECTLIRHCQPIANEYGMYLDYRHPRPARNNQSEVKWIDINGNTHKLDIVIEYQGSETKIGNPRAWSFLWSCFGRRIYRKFIKSNEIRRIQIIIFFN